MNDPVLHELAQYTISPLVCLDEQRVYPGGVIFLDKPGMLTLVSPERYWYEPIEDEL